MHRIPTLALALTLALAVPSGIRAQQAPDASPSASPNAQSQATGPGQMGHGRMMGGRMGGGMMMNDCPMMGGQNAATPADRLNTLKSELAITDAQQSAWNAYAEKMTKTWESMGTMREHMQKMHSAKSPVDRLDARITMMETRLATMKEVKPLLQALYDTLTADQKAKADTSLSPMGCMM
ncbi:MAG: Spy/CpxP family protein refolding chaperone [Hyphomicrobium sp.]|nr:Spy/CpxP family protein refolding chaperone [Hyphomicrobium sp.]